MESLQLRGSPREYEAVAIGHMTAGGTVNEPISRHFDRKRTHMSVHPMGKPAVTHYRIMGFISVRAHASWVASGDRAYAESRAYGAYLRTVEWASGLRVVSPSTERRIGRVYFTLRKFDRRALHATMLRLYCILYRVSRVGGTRRFHRIWWTP